MSLRFAMIICLALLATACKKDDDSDDSNDDTGSTTIDVSNAVGGLYFAAYLDGNAFSLLNGVDGYGNGTTQSGGGSVGDWEEIQGSIYGGLNSSVIAVVEILKYNDQPTFLGSSDYAAMWQVGDYNYGSSEDDNNGVSVDGVIITYVDADGVNWTTSKGTGDQSGSSFNISAAVDATDGVSQKVATGTFSCKLYDGDGNEIVVTNGSFKGRAATF